jgi:hypothetical protein
MSRMPPPIDLPALLRSLGRNLAAAAALLAFGAVLLAYAASFAGS